MNKVYYKIFENKNINFNYIIKYKFESGIVLKGWEVKSFLEGKINIKNSYLKLLNNEIFMKNSIFINSYFRNNNFYFNNENKNDRERKLLLKKKEIYKIYSLIKIYKMIGVIISIYIKEKNNFIKVMIGIGIGKKIRDKRYIIKKREWNIKKNRLY